MYCYLLLSIGDALILVPHADSVVQQQRPAILLFLHIIILRCDMPDLS